MLLTANVVALHQGTKIITCKPGPNSNLQDHERGADLLKPTHLLSAWQHTDICAAHPETRTCTRWTVDSGQAPMWVNISMVLHAASHMGAGDSLLATLNRQRVAFHVNSATSVQSMHYIKHKCTQTQTFAAI